MRHTFPPDSSYNANFISGENVSLQKMEHHNPADRNSVTSQIRVTSYDNISLCPRILRGMFYYHLNSLVRKQSYKNIFPKDTKNWIKNIYIPASFKNQNTCEKN